MIACALLVSCGPARLPPRARSTAWDGLDPGDLGALGKAARSALDQLERPTAARHARSEAVRGLRTLERIVAGPPGEFRAALAAAFDPAPAASVLVTGYYEPSLGARRYPDAEFRYPIYRRPDDLRTDAIYLTRAEIEAGALRGRGLELYWTNDPIGLFFLQVQGSGRLELEDGTVVRLAFAASNGRPYRSIGRVLVDRGGLEPKGAIAPAIKRYLAEHPDEVAPTLRLNERYVFFRVIQAPPDAGPPGSLGAALVPYRSIAIDPGTRPLGAIGVLATALPDGTPFKAVVIAMDTGVAITGPGRVDLFVGTGKRAEAVAGALRSPGDIAWLEPSQPNERE